MGKSCGSMRIIRKWFRPVPWRLSEILTASGDKSYHADWPLQTQTWRWKYAHTGFWKTQVTRSRLGNAEGQLLLLRQQTTMEGLWVGKMWSDLHVFWLMFTYENMHCPLSSYISHCKLTDWHSGFISSLSWYKHSTER